MPIDRRRPCTRRGCAGGAGRRCRRRGQLRLDRDPDPDRGANPDGVIDGDFNGDGDPDLAFANYLSSSAGVSLGLAGFNFETVTTYPVGVSPAQPSAVESAELTGDGDPELIVANRASDSMTVLIGGAGGTFTPGASFPAGNAPVDLATADFNADGLVDVAAGGFFLPGRVSILLGTGGGNFGAPTTITSGDLTSPSSLAAGDFNGDGDPDLAVAHGLSDHLSIFLGAAGATFGAPTNFPIDPPNGIVLEDFNGDGRLDVATSGGSGYVNLFSGGPGGSFTPEPRADVGAANTGIATGDFNRDGDPDVALPNADQQVAVALGAAGMGFEKPLYTVGGMETNSVAVGDYDDDNLPDIAVSNALTDDLYVIHNLGDTTPAAKCLGKKATIVGTDGKDKLRGTGKADVIAGIGGNDTLKGRGGKDRLCGGAGKDLIIGGAAKDRCAGGGAIDRERGCP